MGLGLVTDNLQGSSALPKESLGPNGYNETFYEQPQTPPLNTPVIVWVYNPPHVVMEFQQLPRAAKQSPIPILERKGNPWIDFTQISKMCAISDQKIYLNTILAMMNY